MSMKPKTRRETLWMLGSASVAAFLAACGGESDADSETPGSAGSSGSSGSGGGSSSGGSGGSGGSGSSAQWATNGTSVLSGKDYGNPFASGIGATCVAYKSATEGPCHATSDKLTRKDISEGYPGLPTRLEFLVVDSSCNPVPGAIMEIWHCDTEGVYSGDIDGNNDSMCTGGDAEAAAALWYRGIQTAGEDGRVTFDTNFPGWYGSRATHIHFTITANGKTFTSQVFFDEDLKSEIYNSQPSYKATNQQGYQANSTDKVITESGLAVSDAVMATKQQDDGALLAWKAITLA